MRNILRMSRPAPRQTLQAELFGAVFVLAQVLARRGDQALEPLGLTTRQWLLLAVLAKGFPGEPPTLSEAADVYGTSRQNVKQIAGQLARSGFVRLEADPRDRRALRLHLTPRAAVFDRPSVARRLSGVLSELCAGLGDAELRRLLGLVGRWLAAVSPSTAARRGGRA